MGNDDKQEKSSVSDIAKKVGAITLEEVAAGGAGAAVGLAAGPVAGVAAGVGVKAAFALVRGAFARRAGHRAEKFGEELAQLVANGDEADLRKRLEDPRFEEAVFQNYRRAMDAISPETIPALARLTAEYQGREPDGFFRSAGRLLEELSSSEVTALRQLVSAVMKCGTEVVEVFPWKAKTGRSEVRFKHRGQRQAVGGMAATPDTYRVLQLLERLNLDHDDRQSGADLALEGRTVVHREVCSKLEGILLPIAVEVFDATFDRK
jgi:hypothetical protein